MAILRACQLPAFCRLLVAAIKSSSFSTPTALKLVSTCHKLTVIYMPSYLTVTQWHNVACKALSYIDLVALYTFMRRRTTEREQKDIFGH